VEGTDRGVGAGTDTAGGRRMATSRLRSNRDTIRSSARAAAAAVAGVKLARCGTAFPVSAGLARGGTVPSLSVVVARCGTASPGSVVVARCGTAFPVCVVGGAPEPAAPEAPV